LLVCTDHEIHTSARSYATPGWISWKSMHFSWKDDSPLWIICVSWCQIEREARHRLRLGNLLHLHAIRDSKTWNDSDKKSMTTGNYKTSFFLFMASSFAWKTLIAFKMIAFTFDPHSPFDKPKALVDIIKSILGRAKIHSVDLLDICWTCSYPLSCTLTLWLHICKSEQMTLISEFLFSTKESTNSGLKYFKLPSQKQTVAPSCFDTSCYEKLEKV
jgi:hypothetical protein